MEVIYAPNPVPSDDRTSVFLAGSIEMGNAFDWQQDVIDKFHDMDGVLLNPRRPDWDSTWYQSIENKQFFDQGTWELSGLENCDIIFMYFAPGTKSPISLLELGLHANTEKKMIVCCPPDFWRKGNVDLVCDRYGIIVYDDYELALDRLRLHLA